MLRFGIISEVDAGKGLARVKFDGEDGMVSYWLPMSMPKTQQDKFIIPYDVNEHVWCLMDEQMEYGVIGGAIYDAKNNSTGGGAGKSRVQFVSGLFVEHNRQTNTLAIGGAGKLNIDITGEVTIKCNSAVIESLTDAEVKATALIKLTAPAVLCTGTLQAAAIGIGAAPPSGGNIKVAGNMEVDGTVEATEVKEGAIRLGTHKHTGVQTGGGVSGGPTP